jgi:hypothetical protein
MISVNGANRTRPNASLMAAHHGFDGEEWELLTEAPLHIYLGIQGADAAVDSLDDESRAFEQWLGAAQTQFTTGWLHDLLVEAKRPSPAQAHGWSSSSASELIPKLGAVAAALDRHLPNAEATTFKRSLVALAERVAASSGGLLPGPRVSRAESDVIWKIRNALGV